MSVPIQANTTLQGTTQLAATHAADMLAVLRREHDALQRKHETLLREHAEQGAELAKVKSQRHVEVVDMSFDSSDDGGSSDEGGGSSSSMPSLRARHTSALEASAPKPAARCKVRVKTEALPEGVTLAAFLRAFRDGNSDSGLAAVRALVALLENSQPTDSLWFLREGFREEGIAMKRGSKKQKAAAAAAAKGRASTSTLLMLACRNAKTDAFCAKVVALLVAKGAEPHTLDSLGFAPLHAAARRGYHETLVALLGAGADDEQGRVAALVDIRVDWRANKEHDKRSPLHYAAEVGHRKAVQVLCERGADVDARDATRKPPLAMAVQFGHTDVVQCLIDHNADVNASDLGNYRAIHWIVPAELEEIDPKRRDRLAAIVALLAGAGADMNARCELGGTALDWLMVTESDSFADVAAALVRAGTSALVPPEWLGDTGDNFKRSPLQFAENSCHMPRTLKSMQQAHTLHLLSSGAHEAEGMLGQDISLPLTWPQFEHLKATYQHTKYEELHAVDFAEQCADRELGHYSDQVRKAKAVAERQHCTRKNGSFAHTIELLQSYNFSNDPEGKHLEHLRKGATKFFEPETQCVSFNPARLQKVAVVKVSNRDSREELRGHSKAVATERIYYREIIGVFRGLVSSEAETDKHIGRSFLDNNKRNEYSLGFSERVSRILKSEDVMVCNPLGDWGNEAAAINDGCVGNGKGANCEFITLSYRGFPYIFVVCTPRYKKLPGDADNYIDVGEELLVSYGDGFWQNHNRVLTDFREIFEHYEDEHADGVRAAINAVQSTAPSALARVKPRAKVVAPMRTSRKMCTKKTKAAPRKRKAAASGKTACPPPKKQESAAATDVAQDHLPYHKGWVWEPEPASTL